MLGMRTVLLGFVVVLGSACVLGFVAGCGESGDGTQVQQSPEAKKADQGIQDGMKEFMNSKTQPKAKAK